MYYLNENVRTLNRIFDQNARNGYLRMDLNENPGGLPEEFVKEVLSKVTPELVAKYPEQKEFTEKLGKFIGAELNQICLTNGSAEAIRYVIEAYTRPNGKIVTVSPTYAMYEVYANMYGRQHVPVFYSDEFEVSVKDIIAHIDKETDLVIILNPNNPVGDVYTNEEMQLVVDAAKKCEATVLIDEAYFYFYPNSFVNFALENDHVFLTRTFSKLFSLAGCRLGYVVGQADGIEMIQKMCTPHNVNMFGMLFAQSIIEKDGMLDKMIEKQIEGKKYLINTLREKGYRVNDSEGNFVFIETKTNAKELVSKLKERKILIKYYDLKKLGEFIRVTTGAKDIMEYFIAVLLEEDK